MKRAAEKPPTQNRRWGKPPKPYSVKDVLSARAVLVEYAAQLKAVCVRMRKYELESISVAGGSGSESQKQIENALKALARGLNAALVEGARGKGDVIENIDPEPETS